MCWKTVSALVSLELVLLAFGRYAHAQCGGGTSCGSHGGGHAGGSSSAHLGGAHGGAGHAAFGGVAGAHAWGGLGTQAIQQSSYARSGVNTSFGMNHGAHSAAGSWTNHSVHNRLFESDKDFSASLMQPAMRPDRSTWGSASPTFTSGLRGFHLGSDADNYGYRQGYPMGQHLGHVAMPDRRDPVPPGTLSQSTVTRGLNPVPRFRPFPEPGGMHYGPLIRENILRRTYGLPARPFSPVGPRGDFGSMTAHRSAANPESSSLLGHRCGDASAQALLPQESNVRPWRTNDGAFMDEHPFEDSRAVKGPPTTSAPATVGSTASAQDAHH